MAWNWQKVDWPNFSYDRAQLEEFEAQFLYGSGSLFGALKHLGEEERTQLTIEIISNEALKSSEIEGEYLDRESLQSSLRRHFGLQTDNRKIAPAEQGIAELMNDLYRTSRAPLTHATLFCLAYDVDDWPS